MNSDEQLLCINGKKYFITQEDRKRCMIEDSELSLVVFLYDYELWGQSGDVHSAYVCGSFTSWVENPDFKMTFSPELSLQYLAVPVSALKECGNSSHPEYKFCINGNYISLAGKNFIPEPYFFPSFDKNLMVVLSTDNLEEAIKLNRIAGWVKKLSDFDLESREGQEEISNFRLVPGTRKLFRSFHPFYPTGNRNEIFETEKKRIELVQKLASEEGIKSDINLTDDYTVFAGQEIHWLDGTCAKIEIPPYYQKIIDSKCVCNVAAPSGIVPSYEYVYAKPRDPLFGEWVRCIVNFIIDDSHPAPFQIHCAIGTDRTGVFSAVLGGLCGASWKEVSEDYEKTNRMGINEYRSKVFLAQSFQRLLDVEDISKVKNLSESLTDYFTTAKIEGEPILTMRQIKALIKKIA